MYKKFLFIFFANIIVFVVIEFAVKLTLNLLNYPTVYVANKIGDKYYNFLTGYYFNPNQPEYQKKDKSYYRQGTDRYGFPIDGKRVDANLENKKDDTFRIFLVGGSTVLGAVLENKFDPISARIEKKLNKNFGESKNFNVINTGIGGFMSSQEVSLIQNRIKYAFKPDCIVILNGANEFANIIGKKFFESNSHRFQRSFQRNINKTSQNFLYFFDDWFSKNISTYFLIKKIIEKSSGKLLFDTEARSYIKTKDHLKEVENKIYRYFYNINILKSISSKETPIFVFFQPQMNKKNYENLSNSDKKIYDKFNKYNSNYFKYKTIFYDKVSKKIANEKSILNNEYFKIIDISKLLNQNKKQDKYFSDRVHYTPISREIISNKIFEEIKLHFNF